MMRDQLGSLVEAIKSKVMSSLGRKKKNGSRKKRSPYAVMEKSGSVKVEMRSGLARRLIDATLKAADSPGKASLPA